MGPDDSGTGSFRPTIIERLIISSRMPYFIGIVLVAAFIGPMGNFLFLYSTSGDASSALYGAFFSLNAGEAGSAWDAQFNWIAMAGNVLWYAFLFYVCLIARHLRMRLVKAKPELICLAPNGEETVRRDFGHVSKPVPQLTIALIFLLVYATAVPGLLDRGEFTAFSAPIYIIRSLLRSILFGSVLWLYGGSLLGLYRFGKEDLRLKSCHEDPMLGAQKLGSLAFSFSAAYFLALILFGAQMTIAARAGQAAVVNVIAMLILVPVGIAFFIAPLASTHCRMFEAKKNEIASSGKALSELFNRASQPGEKAEIRMIELMALESAERKVMAIKTWPVESPVVGKLIVIAVSVTATLIARLVQIVVGL